MQTIACEGRCFVLSANQCMRRKHLPNWITGTQSTSNNESKPTAPDDSPTTQPRRASIITRTEDNHEISWPSPEATTLKNADYFPATEEDPPTAAATSKPTRAPRRTSITTRTAENHEITWPSSDAKWPPNLPPSTSQIANGFFPSPLRTSAVPSSDPPNQKSTMRPLPSTAATANKSHEQGSEEDLISRGGSTIISPNGTILAGPLWQVDEESHLLAVTVDFEDCERGRLDIDVAGSYSRSDAFKLHVEGLDISPPP